MTFATSQPGKAIYTLFTLAVNAIRLPFWILFYIPPFFRQHSAYTHKQAVRVRIVRAFLDWASYVEMKTPLSLKPGRESNRFAVLPPAASKFFTASTILDPEIKPEPIGGTWYPAEPKGRSNEWLVLHFHGGAYAIGDGRDHDAGFAAKTIISNSDAAHVFAPQYRLGSNPKGRYPAALQDAITSYVYLLETKKIEPSRIIFSGDSAGANLILSLLRYIGEHGQKTGLPLPAVAWLWSPWVSPLAALQGYTTETENQNYFKDYVTIEFGMWGAKGLEPSPSTGLSIASPELTFIDHPFATPVPLLVSIGECESLFPDQTTFTQQMQGVKGNIVEMQIEKSCVHDTILVGKLTGFEKEAAESVKKANTFLRQYGSKRSAKM